MTTKAPPTESETGHTPAKDTDDDEDTYSHYFESIRSKTGLEIGIRVTWPGVAPFSLSTCLPPQAMAPLFHGTQWAGTRIWRAAVVALEYLLSEECGIVINSDTTVVEYGAGLGLPGIILHALRGSTVVLTDMDDLVEQMRQNLSAFSNEGIQAQPLDWSKKGLQTLLETTGFDRGFDVCLNCDCVFEPLYGDSWKMLLECQEALLQVRPDCYMLVSVERRRFDGIEKYLQAAKESSVVQRIEQVVPSFDHASEVELYRLYGS